MELKDVLAISGMPGLYKFVAQSVNGIIVESLTDRKRMNVSATSKVSSMAEIAIYTEGEDKPLNEIFEEIFLQYKGAPVLSHKSSPEEMKNFLEEVLPSYDKQRVHLSDIKKIIMWYNALIEAGMTNFKVERE